jgi:hypothetical protein
MAGHLLGRTVSSYTEGTVYIEIAWSRNDQSMFAYISTILHEMCHAYLKIYGCTPLLGQCAARACDATRQAHDEATRTDDGKTRHGYS